jgi:hypothetical protein
MGWWTSEFDDSDPNIVQSILDDIEVWKQRTLINALVDADDTLITMMEQNHTIIIIDHMEFALNHDQIDFVRRHFNSIDKDDQKTTKSLINEKIETLLERFDDAEIENPPSLKNNATINQRLDYLEQLIESTF